MREIKFRAWDTIENKMYQDVQNLYDNEVCPRLCNSFGEILAEKDIVVMQYTGLNDKNGKEIWDGDILGLIEPEVRGAQNRFGKVRVLFGEYDDSEIEYGSAGIGWYVEGYHGYKMVDGKREKYRIGGYESQWSLLRCVGRAIYEDRWEVIGNIYENPGLIK